MKIISNYLEKLTNTNPLKFIMLIFTSFIALIMLLSCFTAYSQDKKGIIKAYKVVMDNNVVGMVDNKDLANEAFNSAKDKVINEVNKEIIIDNNMKFYTENVEKGKLVSLEEMVNIIYNQLNKNQKLFKEKVYIIKIDDLKLAVKNKNEVVKILDEAKNKIDLENRFKVTLVENTKKNNCLIPKIEKVNDKQKVVKYTAGVPANLALASMSIAKKTKDESKETEQVDEESPEIVEMTFVESIEVYEGFETRDNIVPVDEAVEMITKENEQNQVYNVEEGDCLSTIANKHDMKTKDLIKLNPDIDEETLLQIGEEVIVAVPEPELSIAIKEKITYKDYIYYTTKKVEDKSKYKGEKEVIEEGENGEKEVTALLSKINGKIVAKEIIEEKVIKEAKERVISEGTKPVPSKSATGSYLKPISGGRISSPFGYRGREFHTGVDFATSVGTTVKASDGGKVAFAGWSGDYGYVVFVDHGNGVQTRYAHLSRISVSVGQKVAKGETIAKTGNTGRSTGPHIHFEIRINGNPKNPLNYIK